MTNQNNIEPGNEAAPTITPPSTLKGLKRQATKIKRERGIRHTEALEISARSMGYPNYKAALNALNGSEDDV